MVISISGIMIPLRKREMGVRALPCQWLLTILFSSRWHPCASRTGRSSIGKGSTSYGDEGAAVPGGARPAGPVDGSGGAGEVGRCGSEIPHPIRDHGWSNYR